MPAATKEISSHLSGNKLLLAQGVPQSLLDQGDLDYSTALGNLRSEMLEPSRPIREAMAMLTGPPPVPMVLVVGGDRKLLGILVDADLRKGLLAGKTLDDPVETVMNPSPITLPITTDPEAVGAFLRLRPRRAVPLVDSEGRIMGLARLSDYQNKPQPLPHTVVIMAGGLGQRLRPLTYHRPKPLVKVGDRPILETSLLGLVEAGFSRFRISVNYLAEQIEEHFGDGSQWGVEIEYLRETKPLGTAGALSLLRGQTEHPIIVLNGDLLTKVNFRSLLEFHDACGHRATICVREHVVKVPFGVVEVNGTFLEELVEKPEYRMLVNAGIYVLDHDVPAKLARNQRMDMTELLHQLRQEGGRPVGCFPVSEYWLDVGHPTDHQRAQEEYHSQFGPARAPGK